MRLFSHYGIPFKIRTMTYEMYRRFYARFLYFCSCFLREEQEQELDEIDDLDEFKNVIYKISIVAPSAIDQIIEILKSTVVLSLTSRLRIVLRFLPKPTLPTIRNFFLSMPSKVDESGETFLDAFYLICRLHNDYKKKLVAIIQGIGPDSPESLTVLASTECAESRFDYLMAG